MINLKQLPVALLGCNAAVKRINPLTKRTKQYGSNFILIVNIEIRMFHYPTATYPIVPTETIVYSSKAFSCVGASIGSSHQVFNNQPHINQVDFISWRKISLRI